MISRLNAIPIKIAAGFLVQTDEQISNLHRNAKDLKQPKQFE